LVHYHFDDFNLGGGFLGIKNKALIGCISQSARKKKIGIISNDRLVGL
jgi:hypothetical protein